MKPSLIDGAVYFSCCETARQPEYWCPQCKAKFCSAYHFDRHLDESGHRAPSLYEPNFHPPWPEVG